MSREPVAHRPRPGRSGRRSAFPCSARGRTGSRLLRTQLVPARRGAAGHPTRQPHHRACQCQARSTHFDTSRTGDLHGSCLLRGRHPGHPAAQAPSHSLGLGCGCGRRPGSHRGALRRGSRPPVFRFGDSPGTHLGLVRGVGMSAYSTACSTVRASPLSTAAWRSTGSIVWIPAYVCSNSWKRFPNPVPPAVASRSDAAFSRTARGRSPSETASRPKSPSRIVIPETSPTAAKCSAGSRRPAA